MPSTGQLVSWLGALFLICGEVRGLGDAVVYAVNCGGEAHTDMLGVKFQRDDNKYGTPSDYGKQLLIGEQIVVRGHVTSHHSTVQVGWPSRTRSSTRLRGITPPLSVTICQSGVTGTTS